MVLKSLHFKLLKPAESLNILSLSIIPWALCKPDFISSYPAFLTEKRKHTAEEESMNYSSNNRAHNVTVHLTLLRDVRIKGQLAMQRTSLVVCIEVRTGFHLGNTDPEPILVLVSEGNVYGADWSKTDTVKAATLRKLESKFKYLQVYTCVCVCVFVATLETSWVQNKVSD